LEELSPEEKRIAEIESIKVKKDEAL